MTKQRLLALACASFYFRNACWVGSFVMAGFARLLLNHAQGDATAVL